MTSQSFSELFESSIQQRNLEEGTDLLAQVLDVNENYVTVSAALKSDARIAVDEFYNSNQEVEVQIGDTVEVEIELLENGMGNTVLSRRNARRKSIWRQIEHAMESEGEVVEGTIQSRVRGGFSVAMDGVRAFLPGSLADVFPAPAIDDMLIGKTMQFKPIKIHRRRNSVVLSRRAVIESSMQNVTSSELLAKYEIGTRVTGTVRAIVDYGAFIEITEGVFGLLHVTDMSWRHTNNITEIMNMGDEVEAIVLRIDEERGRISLGVKQLQPDPWEYFERAHPVQSRTFGKITKVVDYGIFVEIENQLQGLVHTSEMSWSRRSIHPSSMVAVGDEIEVMILEVDRERRRISLGMKQCQNNPWQEFATAYRKGNKINCKVRSISEFGIFMELPGDIEGLVYLADISYDIKGDEAIRQYQKGQEVEAIILSIEPERERIGLGIKQLGDENFNDFSKNNLKGAALKISVVELKEKGAIVNIASHNLRGFLPIGEIAEEHITNIGSHLKIGDEHDAVLLDLDERSKRIIVSLKAKDRRVREKLIQENKPAASTATSLGALVQAKLEESQQNNDS
ncbi:MAG: 30S ribosomal protein S1 [Proteobacteria bacterium]|nr:30S ribosomal protein S1 [Pseudomonadota bacterium]